MAYKVGLAIGGCNDGEIIASDRDVYFARKPENIDFKRFDPTEVAGKIENVSRYVSVEYRLDTGSEWFWVLEEIKDKDRAKHIFDRLIFAYQEKAERKMKKW